ncbi:MAG TPA: VTT domain-containing protein [Vicinamibacterales bacterium]|jgi:membrane protein DedA with SNARE-associated domain
MAGLLLACATLLSEDAATVTAGALVAVKQLHPATAIVWVAFGIFAGDLGLFAIGRTARRVPAVQKWVDRRWASETVRSVETRLNRGAALAILGSRFLPGTRVVLYVAAGLFRIPTATFAICAAVASIIWTSTIVMSLGALGATL